MAGLCTSTLVDVALQENALKSIILALLLLTGTAQVRAAATVEALPQVASGRIERLAHFPSRYVDARNVDVWLPAGYDGSKRYNVLYMHDGQMLFDPALTWNHQAWHVDQAVSRLLAQGKMADTIVVGVWNNGSFRHAEYFPEKTLPDLAPPLRATFIKQQLAGKPQADNYLRFLVEELKPAIDRKYATLPQREHTFIMGSSMGGIISLYAISEYPDVFGAAACLSTHWVATFEANAYFPMAMFHYLQAKLPSPAQHRLYMDRGTETLDALYRVPQDFADQIVADGGYTERNFRSSVFPGAAHTEQAWSARLDGVLSFLFADTVQPAAEVKP